MELHAAARAGDLEKARRLILVDGADVNARDNHNRTPLHLAAWAGHAEMVLLLCENKGAVNAAATDDMAAIHFACQKGHLESVRALLAAGAKATACTRKGLSPLHYAVQSGNATLIKAVARRAPQMMTAGNNKGQKPVDLAKSQEGRKVLEELGREFREKKERAKSKKEENKGGEERPAEEPKEEVEGRKGGNATLDTGLDNRALGRSEGPGSEDGLGRVQGQESGVLESEPATEQRREEEAAEHLSRNGGAGNGIRRDEATVVEPQMADADLEDNRAPEVGSATPALAGGEGEVASFGSVKKRRHDDGDDGEETGGSGGNQTAPVSTPEGGGHRPKKTKAIGLAHLEAMDDGQVDEEA